MRNCRTDGELLNTNIHSTDHQTDDNVLKLLTVDHPLSLLANLPLDEVTEIALLTGKEFKIVYNSVSRLIIDAVE